MRFPGAVLRRPTLPSLIDTARVPLLLLLLLGAVRARADENAISLDIGTGITALSVPAPYSLRPNSQLGSLLSISVGGRYALRNSIELTASVFYEPKVTYLHKDANVMGDFLGSLQHTLTRYGATGGVRYLHGLVFRFTVGIEAGISVRSYSQLRDFDVSNPSAPFDLRLGLQDFTATNFVLAPLAGIEWAFADHASISLLPRVEFLIGREATIGVTAPLVFSWSWYL